MPRGMSTDSSESVQALPAESSEAVYDSLMKVRVARGKAEAAWSVWASAISWPMIVPTVVAAWPSRNSAPCQLT